VVERSDDRVGKISDRTNTMTERNASPAPRRIKNPALQHLLTPRIFPRWAPVTVKSHRLGNPVTPRFNPAPQNKGRKFILSPLIVIVKKAFCFSLSAFCSN